MDTFSLIRRWQDYLKVSGRANENTRRQYRRCIVAFLADVVGDPANEHLRGIRDVTEDDVIAFLAAQDPRGGMRRQSLKALRSFYAWAERRRLLEDNPVRALPLPREKYGKAPTLSAEEREALELNPDDERLANRLDFVAPEKKGPWAADVPTEEMLEEAVKLRTKVKPLPGADVAYLLDHEVTQLNTDGSTVNVVTLVIHAFNPQGRDRLRRDGDGFVTRRSGERFTAGDLRQVADTAPERLSPNVLLRPVVEAALWPTIAYVAGPGELGYLPDAAPLYRALDVTPQTPVPRWSGILVEGRVERVLEKHGLKPEDFAGPPGEVEKRLVREQLPDEVSDALEGLQRDLRTSYGRLSGGVSQVDPTLERTVESARNAALAGMKEIEKKLVAALKRTSDSLVGQLARARAALYPEGAPQERVLTYPSMAIRYGPGLLDAIMDEVARGTAGS